MPQTLGIVASHKNNAWWDAWGAAYERALAGVRQAHIVCVGDSVSQGFYATVPYYTNGWAGRIASNLATRTGVTAGTGVLPVHEEFEVADARTSVTGSWSTFTGGFYGVGRSASSSATFVLGPVTCSAFRITYATESDGGAWTATVDSGTPANYTSNGAAGVTTVDIDAGGSGSHTLTITATNKCYLISVEAIASPTTGVKVSRVARDSQQISALIANADAKSSLRSFRTMTADLVIIEFGLNEAYFGTTTATFEANLRTLIDEAVGIGASVLVVAAPPPNTSHISAVTWSAFRASMAAISTEKKVGYLDMADYWTSYAANTLYYFDNVHPNQNGHADMARIVADFVVETVAPTTPSTFVPTDISNLALWLDADDDASFTLSGSEVSAWNDKSGNARHFAQSTSANRPLRQSTVFGKPVVSFDGSNDFMDAGDTLDLGTSSLSVFGVVKYHNYASDRVVIGKYQVVTNPDGAWMFYQPTNGVGVAYDAGTLHAAASSTQTITDSRVVGVILDRAAGSSTIRIAKATDGGGSFSADSGSNRNIAQPLLLGTVRDSAGTGYASTYLFGYIAELVVYLKAVNTTERDQIETYLSNKWGIR